MTALLGHLMESDFVEAYKGWNSQTTAMLFSAEIVKGVKSDMKELAVNLAREAQSSEMLVIWTDCDREGENIGSEVAKVCRNANPRIKIKRARFSVVQRVEIRAAWRNLVELDMNAAAAVDARSELDLRIGAVFTRFQTLLLKNRFAELSEQKVISYGIVYLNIRIMSVSNSRVCC